MKGILKFLEVAVILGAIMSGLRYGFAKAVEALNPEAFAYLLGNGGNFGKDGILTLLAASVVSLYSYYVSNRGE